MLVMDRIQDPESGKNLSRIRIRNTAENTQNDSVRIPRIHGRNLYI